MQRVILLTLILALAPLAAGMDIDTQTERLPTSLGQAIVGFHDLPETEPGQWLRGHEVLRVEPRADYLVLAADDLVTLRTSLAGLDVAYIEDDAIMTVAAVPNDSRYSDQYGPAQMGAHAAWSTVGYGSSDIIVAVLDTGIRASHEDLAANYIGGYDYVNNDSNPNDDCGHGTHVSGTVAAVTNNGKGVAGVSQASIIHHKVLGPTGGFLNLQCSGSSSDINAAIMDAADQGAHIISMSLGGGGYSNAGNSAVNYAYNKGVLVVAASGNDSSNNGVNYPAAYANAIAVGALTSSKSRASYSNGGPELEIVAGGSSVWSTYNGGNSDYDSLSGTSMATPHVAGALALALSCDPNISHTALRSLMQNTAEDLGANGFDNIYGHGLLRIDHIVNQMTCGGGPGNGAPNAAFTASTNDLTVSLDATGSTDPDGDSLTFTWDFGDGSTGTGSNPSHTYAAAGTYTVTLTANDGQATDTASQSVAVSTGQTGGCGAGFGDLELTDGQAESIVVNGNVWRQICVPSDATSITVTMTGPGCGLTGCSFDADLHVKVGSRASGSNYDCRPYASGNSESCTLSASGSYVSILVDPYSGSGTITLTADHNGQGAPPANQDPTASFSSSCNDLACAFNGGASSDPDGDSLSYAWTFGDGNTAASASPSHTYAAAGTYTVTLTVDDGNGGSDSTSSTVTVTTTPAGCADNGDGVAILQSGQSYDRNLGNGQWAYGKICVQDGTVDVDMTGPSCGLFSCSLDADLYVKIGGAPTTSDYDCRPYQSGNDESCSLANVPNGWVYVGAYAYSGSGTVTVTATA
ncbi:MAG: S8 family serine peptidase [Thermoplasmatota archaeon]